MRRKGRSKQPANKTADSAGATASTPTSSSSINPPSSSLLTSLPRSRAAFSFGSPADEASSQAASTSRPPTSATSSAPTPARSYDESLPQTSLDAADIFDSGAIDYARFLNFPDFEGLYDPQGELLNEYTHRNSQQYINDFVLPFPIGQPQPVGNPPLTSLDPPPITNLVSGLTSASTETIDAEAWTGLPACAASMASLTSLETSAPSGLKRKSDADTMSFASLGDTVPMSKRAQKARAPSSSVATLSKVGGGARSRGSRADAAPDDNGQEDDDMDTTTAAAAETSPNPASNTDATATRKIPETIASRFSNILPAGKVFPIQIGSELFRLSGASLSSDAPSYFSHFFSEQLLNNAGKSGNIKTLYIDRDPQTFRDISLHLQGYHVRPRDGEHYVRLFADAQFYSLPRLTQQLFMMDIYIQVGGRNFQIPRDLFAAPGNSPNFFSLGFAHFFSTPSEVFPGLDRTSLLRPPSIQPPSVPNRSADVFADLLRLLQGYPVHIRDEFHRQDLLRDARYFHLKGLEQQLIPCDVSFNLARRATEIVVRLEDVRQSGVSFTPDSTSGASTEDIASAAGGGGRASVDSAAASVASPKTITRRTLTGCISYARPFTDETSHVLIIEISASEATLVDLSAMRATFTGQTKARIASLFQVIANKMNLPSTQPLGLMMLERGGGIAAMPASPSNSGVSGDRVRIEITHDSWCKVDGAVVEWDDPKTSRAPSPMAQDTDDDDVDDDDDDKVRAGAAQTALLLPRIRSWRPNGLEANMNTLGEWVVTKAQWKLTVRPAVDDARTIEVVLRAVRIQAHSNEKSRNAQRGFLI